MVHEGCCMNFVTRVGNLKASTFYTQVQLSGNQAAVDQIHRVAVEDLVLSQEDKPKKLVRFRVKLPFSIQVCIG